MGVQTANTGFFGSQRSCGHVGVGRPGSQVLGDFGQEGRWLGGALPCAVPGDGWHAEVQLGPGACHAYIRQPAFFFHGALVVVGGDECAAVRQVLGVEAADDDRVELEPLGSVESGQRHANVGRAGALERAHRPTVFQELREDLQALVGACRVGLSGVAAEDRGVETELGQVVEPVGPRRGRRRLRRP